MEGIEEPEGVKEKKKGRKAPLVVGIIIGLIIGFVLFSPNMIGLLYEESESEQQHQTEEPDKSLYENYTKFEEEDTIVYKNEKLNVTITSTYDSYYNYTHYLAEWINIDGDDDGFSLDSVDNNPLELYEYILIYAEELSVNQLKWFEYMCKNIVE